jgi:hypothetical protein
LSKDAFKNREADHAKFLSRVLQGLSKSDVQNFMSLLQKLIPNDSQRVGNVSDKFLKEGSARFSTVAAERGVDISEMGFLECALNLEGKIKKYSANNDFLQSIQSVNPRLTGWPIWLVSSSFREESQRPYTNNNAWEEFIETTIHDRKRLDFMIFKPDGEFYFRRMLEDDGRNMSDQHTKTVDPVLQLLRVAEALVVGQSLGSFLRDSGSEIQLKFAFRWTGLKRRFLTAWSHPELDIGANSAAYQNGASAFVEMGVLANEQDISRRTHEAIGSLTTLFAGYQLPFDLVSAFVFKLLFRKL